MKEKVIKNYFEKLLPMQEVRHFLRISDDYDDDLIKTIVKGVIQSAEKIIGIEISHKEILLEGIFEKNIALKFPFVQVNYVKNQDGNISFSTSKNILKPSIEVGRSIEISYECGLMEDELPSDLKLALLNHIVSLYDFSLTGGKIPLTSIETYNRYRMIKI
jgi:hypothetical protein